MNYMYFTLLMEVEFTRSGWAVLWMFIEVKIMLWVFWLIFIFQFSSSFSSETKDWKIVNTVSKNSRYFHQGETSRGADAQTGCYIGKQENRPSGQ